MATQITFTIAERKQIFKDAIAKAPALVRDQTQILLYADDRAYWIFRIAGWLFIGSMIDDPMPDLFSTRQVYEMKDVNGKLVATMQRLK